MGKSKTVYEDKSLKMYILILKDVPTGHAINSAAHAALACYLKYRDTSAMHAWLPSFKKVSCKVTPEELDMAKEVAGDFVTMTESNLDGAVTAVAFCPREDWPSIFKTFKLWK
jgi:hypothetical protein